MQRRSVSVKVIDGRTYRDVEIALAHIVKVERDEWKEVTLSLSNREEVHLDANETKKFLVWWDAYTRRE